MDIVRLCLSAKKRSKFLQKEKIDNYIRKKYYKAIGINEESYNKLIIDSWKDMSRNLKDLYSFDQILAFGKVDKIDYFIMKDSKLVFKDALSVDILMIYDNKNIDYTVLKVIQHIKKVLYFLKIRIIEEEDVFLYIRNKESDNQVFTEYIRANFVKNQVLYMPEIIQFIFILLASLLSIGFAIGNTFGDDMHDLLIGIGSSGVVYDLSLLIIRVCEVFKRSRKISILDINDIFISNPRDPGELLPTSMESLPGSTGKVFEDTAKDLNNFDPED